MRIRSVPFQAPPSAKAFVDQRDAILRHLRALLGWPPIAAAPPLSPVDCYRSDCGSYVRHKVRYGNETDDVVWAWLLVPTRLTDPVPAVICLPGSFMTPNWGRDAPAGLAGPEHAGDPEAYGADLVRRGYVVLCPDYPAAGERTSPGRRSHDTTDLDRRFPASTRVGLSAWDVSRAVDFLETRREVDRHRIAAMGWSQGGQMAVIGAALEPRITAVVSVCGLAPWRGMPKRQTANLIQPYNYPRLAPYAKEGLAPLDMDHVAACLAPRPFLNLSAREDGTFPNIAEQQAALQQIAALYATLGHADRFAAVWADGPHAYGPAAARETEAWLHRWLWSGSAPDVRMRRTDPPRPAPVTEALC